MTKVTAKICIKTINQNKPKIHLNKMMKETQQNNKLKYPINYQITAY